DIRSVLTQLGIDRAAVVGHDIGATVAYAYAARYPDKTDRLVVMDAPVPGIPPWDEIVRSPALWHFSFGGPDAERLWLAANAFILIVFGTNLRVIRRKSTKQPESITARFMRNQVPCIPLLPSSSQFTRMLKITKFQ